MIKIYKTVFCSTCHSQKLWKAFVDCYPNHFCMPRMKHTKTGIFHTYISYMESVLFWNPLFTLNNRLSTSIEGSNKVTAFSLGLCCCFSVVVGVFLIGWFFFNPDDGLYFLGGLCTSTVTYFWCLSKKTSHLHLLLKWLVLANALHKAYKSLL